MTRRGRGQERSWPDVAVGPSVVGGCMLQGWGDPATGDPPASKESSCQSAQVTPALSPLFFKKSQKSEFLCQVSQFKKTSN